MIECSLSGSKTSKVPGIRSMFCACLKYIKQIPCSGYFWYLSRNQARIQFFFFLKKNGVQIPTCPFLTHWLQNSNHASAVSASHCNETHTAVVQRSVGLPATSVKSILPVSIFHIVRRPPHIYHHYTWVNHWDRT